MSAGRRALREAERRVPPDLRRQAERGIKDADKMARAAIKALQTQVQRASTRTDVNNVLKRIDGLTKQARQVVRGTGPRRATTTPRRTATRRAASTTKKTATRKAAATRKTATRKTTATRKPASRAASPRRTTTRRRRTEAAPVMPIMPMAPMEPMMPIPESEERRGT